MRDLLPPDDPHAELMLAAHKLETEGLATLRRIMRHTAQEFCKVVLQDPSTFDEALTLTLPLMGGPLGAAIFEDEAREEWARVSP